MTAMFPYWRSTGPSGIVTDKPVSQVLDKQAAIMSNLSKMRMVFGVALVAKAKCRRL